MFCECPVCQLPELAFRERFVRSFYRFEQCRFQLRAILLQVQRNTRFQRHTFIAIADDDKFAPASLRYELPKPPLSFPNRNCFHADILIAVARLGKSALPCAHMAEQERPIRRRVALLIHRGHLAIWTGMRILV